MSYEQQQGYGQYGGNPYGGGYNQGYTSGNPYTSVSEALDEESKHFFSSPLTW